MTDEQKELVKKFFEMKAKQMLAKIFIMIHRRPGYVGLEGADEMMRVMDMQSKLESIEDEMMKFLVANESFFRSANAEQLQHEREFQVSFDRQKELAKEVLGYEITIEDLLKQLPLR